MQNLDCLKAASTIREHIPLEQGLRQISIATNFDDHRIREHIPLEQGLRPNFEYHICSVVSSESIFH